MDGSVMMMTMKMMSVLYWDYAMMIMDINDKISDGWAVKEVFPLRWVDQGDPLEQSMTSRQLEVAVVTFIKKGDGG